jgi:hypothetical protein
MRLRTTNGQEQRDFLKDLELRTTIPNLHFTQIRWVIPKLKKKSDRKIFLQEMIAPDMIINIRIQILCVYELCPPTEFLNIYRTQHFGDWISFRLHVDGGRQFTLFGPLERVNLNH